MLDDAVHWLSEVPESCLHAIVTDAPNGLIEYSEGSSGKNPAGRGGVWRIPPSFGGAKRSPLPRVTILKPRAIEHLQSFLSSFARTKRCEHLPRGRHMFVASNPLLFTTAFYALQKAGCEKRGEIPEGSHRELERRAFSQVLGLEGTSRPAAVGWDEPVGNLEDPPQWRRDELTTTPDRIRSRPVASFVAASTGTRSRMHSVGAEARNGPSSGSRRSGGQGRSKKRSKSELMPRPNEVGTDTRH